MSILTIISQILLILGLAIAPLAISLLLAALFLTIEDYVKKGN